MESSVGGEEKVAVAFSGGLDSSVVATCAAADAQVIACTAYADGAGDSARARRAADALGVELVVTRLTPETVAREIAGIDLPFEATLMDRSLWCLYSIVSQSAREAGARLILLGQLADELFGGYAKYYAAMGGRGADVVASMMEADVEEYFRRGRIRDMKACSRWVEPRLPFEQLVGYAATIPMSLKMRDGVRKAVLRRAAVELGVPETIAWEPKKAAQYSSGVQKLVANAPFNSPE
ncbi:MAG: asparagine synthase [Nitrososphaerota archaeon]|nr:asparagine synthase C-terminal domain-containing protein [Nitrososphaerota archaeon]MDG6903453.1 asparagine synthase [Nitrososphaerota archaeon]MDG6924804.1 asparagine synthase [Nitrososphaerota archaeon]MDG6940832.1 asparagine synthase [Nitrososphaerota archaeon]MDG6945196.1 asparagine synthase [Nitrososphaerota archaeon]